MDITLGCMQIMSTVSISKAAKLAGISRTHFYRKYLSKGIVSISKDEIGKPCIEMSELIRVFNVLHRERTQATDGDSNTLQKCNVSEEVLLEKVKGLEALLRAKEEEIENYRNREKYLYQLLEHKPKKRRWFGFIR